MKRFVKKYLLVMVVSLSSCQFLEKFPDSNADVRIDTKEKVQELLTVSAGIVFPVSGNEDG